MPGGMNGVQLTVEARRIRPELKVLLSSGYTAAALSREHGLPDTLDVVEKPYQREKAGRETQAGNRRISGEPSHTARSASSSCLRVAEIDQRSVARVLGTEQVYRTAASATQRW